MSVTYFGITWAHAAYSWCLLLVVIAVALVWYRTSKKIRAYDVLAKMQGYYKPLKNASIIRTFCSAFLMTGATVFLGLALLGPSYNKKEQMIKQEGRDVIIGLDVSRSMLAQDCTPNRLECAKQKIKQLVQKLESERVGLLVFSGSAMVLCPLTRDYDAFYDFLDNLGVETVTSGATALDQALVQAVHAFGRAQTQKTKLFILFTDGEDFSQRIDQVKKEIVDQHLLVCAVGIGTDHGSPIPLYDEQGVQMGHIKDEKGAVVFSKLNEPLLKVLAQKTGGVYVRMTTQDSDIRQLVHTIAQHEKEEYAQTTITGLKAQYPWFVGVAAFALALEWLLA